MPYGLGCPVSVQLTEMLEARPHTWSERFVFPSPTGRHEQNMLLKCKGIAERAGLNPMKFELKTFRSTIRACFGPGLMCGLFSSGWATNRSRRPCDTWCPLPRSTSV
jgi:hypothetical protein